MRTSYHLALGSWIAIGSMMLGCAQILGDYGIGTRSSSGVSTEGTSDAATTGAGGSGGSGAGGATSSATAGPGGQGGSGGTPNPCPPGSINLIKDDFSDSEALPLWESYTDDPGHITVQEMNGELYVTSTGFSTSTSGALPFGGYRSVANNRLSLLNCSMAVEVNGTDALPNTFAVRVELINDSDPATPRLVRISQVGSSMIFHNYPNGDPSAGDPNAISIPYDPAAHHWWRFRETQGTIYAETSPDGKAWTSQMEFQTPDFVGAVRINLTLGFKQHTSSGTAVRFDNVNNLPP